MWEGEGSVVTSRSWTQSVNAAFRLNNRISIAVSSAVENLMGFFRLVIGCFTPVKSLGTTKLMIWTATPKFSDCVSVRINYLTGGATIGWKM